MTKFSTDLSTNQRFNHWFDGMALLHQFKISNGQVTYKSRFLSSDSYQSNREQNRIVVAEFGTITMPDPCKNFFQRFLSRFELPSECCILSHNCLERQNGKSQLDTNSFFFPSRTYGQCQCEHCELQGGFLCQHRK